MFGFGHTTNQADASGLTVHTSDMSAGAVKWATLFDCTIPLYDCVVSDHQPPFLAVPPINIGSSDVHLRWGVTTMHNDVRNIIIHLTTPVERSCQRTRSHASHTTCRRLFWIAWKFFAANWRTRNGYPTLGVAALLGSFAVYWR